MRFQIQQKMNISNCWKPETERFAPQMDKRKRKMSKQVHKKYPEPFLEADIIIIFTMMVSFSKNLTNYGAQLAGQNFNHKQRRRNLELLEQSRIHVSSIQGNS